MTQNIAQPDSVKTVIQKTENNEMEKPGQKNTKVSSRLEQQPIPVDLLSGMPSPAQKPRAKSQWLRPSVWCILVPFVLSCCYFGFIATDRFVGEAKVIVKQADNNTASNIGLAILGTGISTGAADAQLVSEFILSLDMLRFLDDSIALKTHYQSLDADIISRLGADVPQEDFLEYYREHITVAFNEQSAVLTVRAQAFTPGFAQKIVQTIIKHSEEYINQISHDLAQEQVGFVTKELERAAGHLRQSKQNILEFQELHKLFSPEQESGAKLAMVNQLEGEITQHKAELNNLRSYMNDSAAEVIALGAKIAGLENQLVIERKKLVGDTSNTFSDVNAKYADLQLDLEFATDLYKSSVLSLEQARIEAYRKLKHLVVVDSPSLPEDSEYPRRLYNVVSILVVLCLAYGAVRITLATIREHRDV